jgi:hypothetical protein
MKKILFTTLTLVSSIATAAPGQTECQMHKAVNSPTGQLVSIVGIVGGFIPAAGLVAIAASSYRFNDCPRPRLMTEDEVRQMIQEALAAKENK